MKQDIEKLLEKYYEGETTLAEEKLLRQFFNQEDAMPVRFGILQKPGISILRWYLITD